MAKKIPTTILGRTASLLGSASKIVGREIAATISETFKDRPEFKKAQTRVKQAQDLVESLSHLKGAAMKVGQLLSLEMSDLLPPDVVEVLRTLHDNATFLPAPEVVKILRRELGPEKLKHIKNLSPEPIAAASIGQVHRAQIHGQEVVLKVQYPGVAESIDTDIAMLKKLINSILTLRGRKISFDSVFAELAEGLKIETDYGQEADAIGKYASVFADYPQYIIPKTVPDFCTKKVLTLSYEEGDKLNLWIKRPWGDAVKDRFAGRVLDLLLHEFFTFGLVQTDPNYGNFLVRDDGDKLVLLDFGAVREYPQKFRTDLYSLLACAITCDRDKISARAIELGFLDPRESVATKDLFFTLMELIASMFKDENQPFSFASEVYLKNIRETSMEFANQVQFTSPAHQIIFLNRKLGGMYHLLKDANCKVDLSRYWKSLKTDQPT